MNDRNRENLEPREPLPLYPQGAPVETSPAQPTEGTALRPEIISDYGAPSPLRVYVDGEQFAREIHWSAHRLSYIARHSGYGYGVTHTQPLWLRGYTAENTADIAVSITVTVSAQ